MLLEIRLPNKRDIGKLTRNSILKTQKSNLNVINLEGYSGVHNIDYQVISLSFVFAISTKNGLINEQFLYHDVLQFIFVFLRRTQSHKYAHVLNLLKRFGNMVLCA